MVKRKKGHPIKRLHDVAMRLYFSGVAKAEIARLLDVSPATITGWSRRENWDDVRANTEDQAISQIVNEHKDDIIAIAEQHFEAYRSLRLKTADFLGLKYPSVPLVFDKTPEAVRALDLAIKGEREVQAGLISYAFVQAVLNVIVEEVKDEATISRIAIKFKELAANYQQQERDNTAVAP